MEQCNFVGFIYYGHIQPRDDTFTDRYRSNTKDVTIHSIAMLTDIYLLSASCETEKLNSGSRGQEKDPRFGKKLKTRWLCVGNVKKLKLKAL